MAWKASWAHRTGENEEKKDNDKIKKIGQNVERLWFKTIAKHLPDTCIPHLFVSIFFNMLDSIKRRIEGICS